MNLIKQKGFYDCGAACLATVLRLNTIEQAYTILGYDPNQATPAGTADLEIIDALARLGFASRQVMTPIGAAHAWNVPRESVQDRNGLISLTALEKLSRFDMIAQVASPGGFAGGHNVVFHDGVCLDPSLGAAYNGMKLEGFPVWSAILIYRGQP